MAPSDAKQGCEGSGSTPSRSAERGRVCAPRAVFLIAAGCVDVPTCGVPHTSCSTPAPDASYAGHVDLDQALLEFLRKRAGRDDLEWRRPPARIGEGAEAIVYRFEVGGSPSLALRLCPGSSDAELRREAAFTSALDELGYPVPAVHAVGGEEDGLGAAFAVVEWLPGRALFDWVPWMLAWSVACLALGAPLLAGLPFIGYWVLTATLMARLHRVPVTAMSERLESPDAHSLAARLDDLERMIAADPALEFTSPGLAWLRDHAPLDAASVVCHGDLWAGNILVEPMCITGVIDWTQGLLAPREYDLAWSRLQHLSRQPLPQWLPGFADEPLWRCAQPFAWLLFQGHAWAYRAIRGADRKLLEYFAAYHALRVLVWVQRVPERARGRWDAPMTLRNLRRVFRRHTGIKLIPAAGYPGRRST